MKTILENTRKCKQTRNPGKDSRKSTKDITCIPRAQNHYGGHSIKSYRVMIVLGIAIHENLNNANCTNPSPDTNYLRK